MQFSIALIAIAKIHSASVFLQPALFMFFFRQFPHTSYVKFNLKFENVLNFEKGYVQLIFTV